MDKYIYSIINGGKLTSRIHAFKVGVHNNQKFGPNYKEDWIDNLTDEDIEEIAQGLKEKFIEELKK